METSRRSARRVSAKRPAVQRAAAPRPATGAPEREDERDPLAERDTIELEPELRRLVDLATD